MGKKRARSRSHSEGVALVPPMVPPTVGGAGIGPETTGRYIVILKDQAVGQTASVKSMLSKTAGIRDIAASSDFNEGAVPANTAVNNNAVHFEKLGIIVVSDIDAVQAMTASAGDADSPILAIEPEYIARLLAGPGPSQFPMEYLEGYRDAVNELYEQLARRAGAQSADLIAAGASAAGFQDTQQFTWGLQATGVDSTSRSGQGTRVAVLDTGIDLQHPDFQGRQIISQSFSGVPVQDVFGHGTHCCGTACGPQTPATGGPRYGIAYNAQLFVGKVFDNNSPRPGASTSAVVAGIEWAITQKCQVASLSLGVDIDQQLIQYTAPTMRALQLGTLVIAAAGNNADRRIGKVGFVTPPANADAAMAVGAIDNQLQIPYFSSRSSSVTGVGGLVNICGPGVDVYSSWPGGGHKSENGTSMATPHVAGIAALWSEETNESGPSLWSRLIQTVRPLSLPGLDAGAGLVQAPQ